MSVQSKTIRVGEGGRRLLSGPGFLPLVFCPWVFLSKTSPLQSLHFPICTVARVGPILFEVPSSLGSLDDHHLDCASQRATW